jgi:DNA-binding response OmpR family regulator
MDVLIIDDDRAVRHALGKSLERAGYVVETVASAAAAASALQRHSYRTIVCDIRMPFLDGVSFYDELKDVNPQAANRVVFVTAFADEPTIRTFLERIDRPVVEKPFEMEELLAVVKESRGQA